MFDAAIKVLRREELRLVDPPAGISDALRVLEAAGKVDGDALDAQMENGSHGGPCRGKYCVSFALLSALPDKIARKS